MSMVKVTTDGLPDFVAAALKSAGGNVVFTLENKDPSAPPVIADIRDKSAQPVQLPDMVRAAIAKAAITQGGWVNDTFSMEVAPTAANLVQPDPTAYARTLEGQAKFNRDTAMWQVAVKNATGKDVREGRRGIMEDLKQGAQKYFPG